MKFAQVERDDGLRTFVNAAQIQYFEKAPGGSRIHFSDGQAVMLVAHTPYELSELFKVD